MNVILTNDTLPLRIDDSGAIRVGGTRVTLDTVVEAFVSGATAEQIVQDFSVLCLADVYAAIGFYLRHRSDVDAYLAERRQRGRHIRETIEANGNLTGIRERLLARRAGSK